MIIAGYKHRSWHRPSTVLSFAGGWLLYLASGQCSGDTFRVLHHFTGSEGSQPQGSLALVGTQIYGTTRVGGSAGNGIVYKINMDGDGFTVLKHFSNSDGHQPQAGLVCSGTTLYGTTPYGGDFDGGTVFRLETDGTGFQVLKSFNPSIGEGHRPCGLEALLLSGNTLYGMTDVSGSSNGVAYGWGTVYKIQTDGTGFAVLKNFPSGAESYPFAGLVLGGATLYGTTSGWEGANLGTVFKINTDGTAYASLWQFTGGSDASFPLGGVVLSGDTLFGTTYYGPNGQHYGSGTVFRMNTDGTGFKLLQIFGGGDCPAWWPEGGLLLSRGVLYGTTVLSSNSGPSGAVYALTTNGNGFAILKRFTGADGASPLGSMALSDGMLYGTAGGGDFNQGILFTLGIPTPSLVNIPTQTAEIGTTVDFSVWADGSDPMMYQWVFNETNLLHSSTNNSFLVTNIQPSQAGTYKMIVTNVFGAVTSSPVVLGIIPSVPRRTVPGLTLTTKPAGVLHLDRAVELAPTATWTTFDTVALEGTSQWYFDLATPLRSQQFYRAWQTNSPGLPPRLELHMIPAITLAGTVGDSLRLDYINQVGPIDAWVTLATIVLTNSSQLYFDTSSVGMPTRLYRIMRMP